MLLTTLPSRASTESLLLARSENRYTAQVRFANQSVEFDWLLAGDDDTLFLMDNVVDLVRDLDPNEPYYLTDALPANGLSCTLLEEASERGPSDCIKTPPAAPCTRAVLEDPSVCHSENPTQRQGHFDIPPGTVWGFGQSGMLVSRGLLRSISEEDMLGCEYCNVTDFCHTYNEGQGVCNGGGCYGGGDVRLGECFWRFAGNRAGIGPTVPYSHKDVKVFGHHLGDILAHAEQVIRGEACDEKCHFVLDRVISTDIHHATPEEYRRLTHEFSTRYGHAKRALHGRHSAAIMQGAAGANTSAADTPSLSLGFSLEVAVLVVGQPKVETPLVFESIRSRILDRLRAKQHRVHVFLCEDPLTLQDSWTALSLERLRPFERFAIDANSQLERNLKCFEKLEQQNFDWFVRTRPDLVLWDDVPDLEHLDDGAIHARLLSAVNITGLHFGTFNTAFDTDKCNGDVCGRPEGCTTCAVFEDQLALVPRSAAQAYFNAFKMLEGASGSCWPTNGFPEGFFTRAVLRGGGRFVPLTLEARLWGRLAGMHENVPILEHASLSKNCT